MKTGFLTEWHDNQLMMEEYVRQLKEFDTVSSSCFRELPGNGSGVCSSDVMTRTIIKRDKIRSRLFRKYHEYLDLVHIANRFVETLSDKKASAILLARDRDELTWAQVAARMGGNATADSVKKVHERFLKKLEDMPEPIWLTEWYRQHERKAG